MYTFSQIRVKVKGIMVSKSYTFGPFGDYNVSATNAEYTGLQQAFHVYQIDSPDFGSSQPVNHVSFVNGSGPEGGSKSLLKKVLRQKVVVIASAAEHEDNPGNFFFV